LPQVKVTLTRITLHGQLTALIRFDYLEAKVG